MTSLEPDTATLDRVYDLITRVPALHRQHMITSRPADRVDLAAQLAKAPDLRPLAECGTAACVAGWALIVKGYGIAGPRFTYPPGHVLPDGTSVGGRLVRADIGSEAAAVLGLPYDEAVNRQHGWGLFWSCSTTEDLEDWCAYYHGQLPQDELYRRLEERRLERDGE